MSRFTFVIAAMALLGHASAASAQEPPQIPEEMQARKLPRQHLSGPRFGFTTFTGETADQRDLADLEPIMTQFGWQWETQIVSLTGGNQALMEWVLLVGGVEQDEFNLSLGWLTGYRLANGIEIGVGPNFSFNKDSEDITPVACWWPGERRSPSVTSTSRSTSQWKSLVAAPASLR